MKISLLINMKMPTIVGIFIFISRENFMLNWVEHEKSFITSGPDQPAQWILFDRQGRLIRLHKICKLIWTSAICIWHKHDFLMLLIIFIAPDKVLLQPKSSDIVFISSQKHMRILMSTHNIYMCGEIRKILSSYPLLSGATIFTKRSRYMRCIITPE